MKKANGSIAETEISLLSEGSEIEGKVTFERKSRIHGIIKGEVYGNDGSCIIVADTCKVEGQIIGDEIIVDGYVRGKIFARSRVVLSSSARVFGSIETPSLQVEFGACFDGQTLMENARPITTPSAQPA